MRRLQAAALVLALVLPVSALAQTNTIVNFRGSTNQSTPVSAANPLPVNASVSVSASIGAFGPSLAYGTCTATGSACASTAIPTNTGTVILFNSGTTTVSCTVAAGAASATTNELQIPASSGLSIATTYGATTYDHFSCIDQTGSTSNVVVASGGTGLPTAWGGGGGGGGGAVTLASGAVSSGAYSSGSIASGAYASGAFASGAAASGSWADGSIVTLGTKADTACAAAPCSTNGWLAQIHSDASAGTGSFGSAQPSSGIAIGGKAQSSEPAAATTGNLTAPLYDLAGKAVISPYANRENAALGTGSGTTTGAITVIAASGSASLKTYVTSVQCARDDAGTTAIHVTFNDSKSSILVLPNNGGGGGNNATFAVPIVTAANTAFTATPSGATTTVYCNAQGFYGY